MRKSLLTVLVVVSSLFLALAQDGKPSKKANKKKEKTSVVPQAKEKDNQQPKIRKLTKADKYFQRGEYLAALTAYKKMSQKPNAEESVYRNMGIIYYNLSDFKSAASVYKTIFTKFRYGLTEDDYFKLLHINKALGKYKQANSLMVEYFNITDDKEAIAAFQKETNRLEDVRALGERYKIKNLKAINTSSSEFGAVRYGDQLMFSGSAREKQKSSVFGWNGEGYLDIYFTIIGKSKKGVDEVSKDVKPVPGDVNTRFHDATFSITRDGKTMYFTSNTFSHEKKIPSNEKHTLKTLQIYKVDYIDGKWQNAKPISISSKLYSIEHPALSPDEKTLYFASDMPGGYGGFDLYSVALSEKGDSTGTPKNLGSAVNTKYREQFPFVTKANQLYFASDRISGFGSLDVYVSEIDGDFIGKAENVGLPLNSPYDDFAFYIDVSNNRGYFSSNRPKGSGKDDIYELLETKPLKVQNCKQTLSGTVKDSITKEVIAEAKLMLKTVAGQVVHSLISKTDGSFLFPTIDCQEKYVLEVSKSGYINTTLPITTDYERQKENKRDLVLYFKGDMEQQIEKELTDVEKSKIDQATQNIKNVEADFVRSERAIAADEGIIKKKDVLMIKMDNIYFDFNLWYLRKEARETLDTLLGMMKKYPDLEVEIGVHSDNRGNEDYNMALSQKRASVVKDYLIERGLSQDRLSAKGYGETMPVVDCVTRRCTEEEYEQNRRSEFVITYF